MQSNVGIVPDREKPKNSEGNLLERPLVLGQAVILARWFFCVSVRLELMKLIFKNSDLNAQITLPAHHMTVKRPNIVRA